MAFMDGKAGNGTAVFRKYNIEEHFTGYHARLSASVKAEVEARDEVAYVEENMMMYALEEEVRAAPACTVQKNAEWNLVRMNERERSLDGLYQHHDDAGANVDAYVVDTGVYLEHSQFGGKAIWGYDAVDRVSSKTDEQGHGTHVAGTIMSALYGVTKEATIIAVKVLNRNGQGTNAGVIDGVNWVATEYKKRKNPSVANMSLGGGYSKALNDAVNAAVKAGVTFAVAAGNESQDACNVSPSSAADAICVGASDSSDRRSYFSNYGKCVDIFAPGSDIMSTWIGSKYATNTISGTSMASPGLAYVPSPSPPALSLPTPPPLLVFSLLGSRHPCSPVRFREAHRLLALEFAVVWSPSTCRRTPRPRLPR